MESRSPCSFQKVFAVASTLINVVDYILDLNVLIFMATSGQWGIFWISFSILLLSLTYVAFALVRDGRHLSALLHFLGMAIVLDAFNYVILGRVPSVSIPLQTSQPMQGLAVRLVSGEQNRRVRPQESRRVFVSMRYSEYCSPSNVSSLPKPCWKPPPKCYFKVIWS